MRARASLCATAGPAAHNVLPHEKPAGGAPPASLSATLLVCVSLLALATICSFQVGVASMDLSSVRCWVGWGWPGLGLGRLQRVVVCRGYGHAMVRALAPR